MGLTWRATSTQRWLGSDDDGKQIGHVGLVVTEGGAKHVWLAEQRNRDRHRSRQFLTAEEAMVAVDTAE